MNFFVIPKTEKIHLVIISHKIAKIIYLFGIGIWKLRGTIVNVILPPRVLFYRREIHFTAASFIFTTASFILLSRDLF